MTESPEERHLRSLFRELRREVDASVSAFEVRATQPVRTGHRRLVMVTATAAVVMAAVMVARVVRDDHNPEFGLDLAATTWVAPTDFLLDTPGSDLLRSLPEIGMPAYTSQSVTGPGAVDTSS